MRRAKRPNWSDLPRNKLPKTLRTIRDKRQKQIRKLKSQKTNSLMKARPRDPVMLNRYRARIATSFYILKYTTFL